MLNMSNSVAENIANFLKEYSPFSYLSHDELIQVSSSIGVVNLDQHKILFNVNDKLHDSFYVVASGVVALGTPGPHRRAA